MAQPPETFSDENLPATFQAADATAIRARRRYLRFVKANLVLVLTGAAFFSVSVRAEETRRLLNLVSAACFGLGLVVSVATASANDDRIWPKARERAEDIKAKAWRFMAGAEPFLMTLPLADAEAAFLAALVNDRQHGAPTDPAMTGRREITSAMLAVRTSPLSERSQMYSMSRLNDQRRWYAAKATASDRSARFWSVGLFCAQGGALLSALAAIWRPFLPLNGRTFFTALAGLCLGWLRATQHRQLSTVYADVANALNILMERALRARNEDELNTVVQQAELTMSRERDTWIARRTMN